MCVYCEATCVVLELTFVKGVSCFFVYGSCRKKETYVRRSKKVEKNKKRAVSSLQKKGFLSPVFCSVFHSYSAEFLQQVVSLILLCFPYLFYCPWSVSCWKIQPTVALLCTLVCRFHFLL
jgi:hypothetical protein